MLQMRYFHRHKAPHSPALPAASRFAAVRVHLSSLPGKIRDVEKELGISYPTVIKRLDLVNVLLGNQAAPAGRTQILEELERGEITVQEATQLLKQT
jgi:hypothetical protein